MRLRDDPVGHLKSSSRHRCRHPEKQPDGQPLCPGDRHHQRPNGGKIGNSYHNIPRNIYPALRPVLQDQLQMQAP
ncbi:hypothetical protein HPB48_013722 [Haemaphysalis longicornis]|uniref:Uncharacterized protein n=1 Tax=Haemaphysalis longicornis TaxID=44386 RepID=A0A9J6GRS4_HAELO|nr:hypothetical protein HPB48_013722 [Haemaphysalis longicornis]